MPEDHDSRTLISPRTGTKVSLLIAIPLLLAAAYFFWSPITLQSPQTGSVFNCGNAASLPTDGFQKGTCGDLNKQNRYRAIVLALTGLAVGGLGAAMFGADRREEHRLRRDRDERRIGRDEDEYDDRPRSRGGDGRRDDGDDDHDDRRSAQVERSAPDDEDRGRRWRPDADEDEDDRPVPRRLRADDQRRTRPTDRITRGGRHGRSDDR